MYDIVFSKILEKKWSTVAKPQDKRQVLTRLCCPSTTDDHTSESYLVSNKLALVITNETELTELCTSFSLTPIFKLIVIHHAVLAVTPHLQPYSPQ